MSGAYASSVFTVSLRDSPLSTLEPLALRLIVSAESRFAASSKDDEVRVDDSKKRLTTVRPRSAGTFLTSRASTPAKPRAPSRMRSTSSRPRSETDVEVALHGATSSPAWTSTISSAPSSSTRRTLTRSSRAVGRFLPT